jgi:hypothetical protein
VTGVDLGPNSNFLYSVSEDGTLRKINIDDGSQANSAGDITSANVGVKGVAAGPNGNYVYTASDDNTVRKFWTNNLSEIDSFGISTGAKSVDVGPSGNYIYSGDQFGVVHKVWTSNMSEAASFTGNGNSVDGIDVGPNGNYVYTASDDNTVRKVWVSNMSESSKFEGHPGDVQDVVADSSGNFIYSAGGGYQADGSVRKVWVSNMSEASKFSDPNSVNGVDVGPNGNYVYAAAGDDTARKLDTSDMSEAWSYTLHSNFLEDVNVGPDGDYVYTASADNEVHKIKDVTNYAVDGFYESDTIDAGSVQDWNTVQVDSSNVVADNGTVEVEFSNSSDFSSSSSQSFDLTGGVESFALTGYAQYARFNVSLSDDGTDTPRVDRVTVKYGDDASAYGYKQVALGEGANTTVTGAVAIGHKAQAHNEYEATFGNLNGDELDVNVTGNLTIHGVGGLDMESNPITNVSDPDDPQDAATKSYVDDNIGGETEGLSETLTANNTANQSVDMNDNSVDNAKEVTLSNGLEVTQEGDTLVLSD